MLATDRSQVLQNKFRTLRFARARLARDNDTLILAISFHMGVRIISDRKDMRRKFAYLTFFVQLDLVGGIDGQDLIRINSHQNRTGVCL